MSRPGGTEGGRQTTRLDKWLWHARFFRTRTLAAEVVASGHVRVNARRVEKPAHAVGPGDTLTFAQGTRIRVVRIIDLGVRRQGAPEAAALFADLDGPRENLPPPVE